MTKKQKKMLVRILISAVMVVGLKLLPFNGFINIVLYMATYLVIGYDILRKAGKGIVNGQVFDENFLMAVATVGAIALATYEKSGDYKPFSPRNVLARVETVLRRTQKRMEENKQDVVIIGNHYITVDFTYRKVEKQGEEIHLTPTEYKIFELLVRSPNRVFSREQIISYALEDEFAGYDRSIDTYIKSIRQKVEPDGKMPRYFVTVYGVGYKFVL